MNIGVSLTVGYCASCAHLRRHATERPVPGLARFGRCKLGVRPIGGAAGMCVRWTKYSLPISVDKRNAAYKMVAMTQTSTAKRLAGRDRLAVTQLRVSDEDGTIEGVATCADWCEANPEDAETFRLVALAGNPLYCGGGAMPLFLIERIA